MTRKAGGSHSAPPATHHDSPDKQHGPTGDTKDAKKNKDGKDVQRDKNGNIDNNKNGKSDGSGIDINSTRPTDPALASVYDEKKQLAAQGKMDEMTAKQALTASLAEIRQWAKDAEPNDIG